MVHALKTIHDLLKPNGLLIDLRPKGIPAEFWGHKGGATELLGHIQETDDFVEYRHAAWAMEQAIDKKWFRLLDGGEYDFIIHADSFEELKSYLTIEWTDAVIPDDVRSNAVKFKAEKITLRDYIHLGILLAV